MSIPLDRLYHYLENLCGDDTIIYHWYPHGSKKLENLTMFKDYSKSSRSKVNLSMTAIFHDQEPLCFDNYTPDEIHNSLRHQYNNPHWGHLTHFRNLIDSIPVLRATTINPFTVYDKIVLCHSEQNSKELRKFEEHGYIGVYYWAHAVIARDWFRYAEHDQSLQSSIDHKYDFLIYNRAWTGTREYRLKFCEMLVDAELVNNCKTSFAPVDNDTKYTEHTFANRDFALKNLNLENHFNRNTTTSCYSADYNNVDYQECGVEVVLETLFDDQRNHLTEKVLRSIACNKPFIIAATPYSLQYLRKYGFKTFNGLIDESYDTIINPMQRLEAIVRELKRIASLTTSSKQELWKKLNEVSEYNQKLFFSSTWHDMIVQEFKTNFSQAMLIAKKHQTGKYIRKFYSQIDTATITDPEILASKKIIDQWLLDNGYSY